MVDRVSKYADSGVFLFDLSALLTSLIDVEDERDNERDDELNDGDVEEYAPCR